MTLLDKTLSTLLDTDSLWVSRTLSDSKDYLLKIRIASQKYIYILDQANDCVLITFGGDYNKEKSQLVKINDITNFLIKYPQLLQKQENHHIINEPFYHSLIGQAKKVLMAEILPKKIKTINGYRFQPDNIEIDFETTNQTTSFLSFPSEIDSFISFLEIKTSMIVEKTPGKLETVQFGVFISPLEFDDYPILKQNVKIKNHIKNINSEDFLNDFVSFCDNPTVNKIVLAAKLEENIPENDNKIKQNKI